MKITLQQHQTQIMNIQAAVLTQIYFVWLEIFRLKNFYIFGIILFLTGI